MARTIKQLEARVEKIRAEQEAARIAARSLRTAKGPWAATNQKANKRKQAKLANELREVGTELFKAKLRAEATFGAEQS